MIGAFSLWLPILLSAVFVFIASSIIHMVLKYHNSAFNRTSSIDQWPEKTSILTGSNNVWIRKMMACTTPTASTM
jgi:hypothetical protein